MSHAGWTSRGYLPHCDANGLVQHIIFGLDDAMPRTSPSNLSDPESRAHWADRELDAGLGSRLLGSPAHAKIAENCLLHGDGDRYALIAWCIMPTHVHVLVEQNVRLALADVIQTWKSFTAHAINKASARKGRVWRREYFDRFMRSPEQFDWTLAYVENNPVAAGLAAQPQDWRFSSAWRRHAGEDAGGP